MLERSLSSSCTSRSPIINVILIFLFFNVSFSFYYYFFEKSKMSLDNETVIVPPCNLSKNAPVNFAYYVYNHSNAMGPIAIAYFF